PVPIEIVRGEHDPSSDPVAIRNFCEYHKGKITVNEIPGAGYLTFITHTNEMIRLLNKALD
ncbi:MAG: alpha/beta hydrolase, partial [Pseudomonadota bacterium]